MERGLRFVTIEQETLGGTVASYPARQARHDRARDAADRRQGEVQGNHQGGAARVLARASSEDRRSRSATASGSRPSRRRRRVRVRDVEGELRRRAVCSRSAVAARRASSACRARTYRRSLTGSSIPSSTADGGARRGRRRQRARGRRTIAEEPGTVHARTGRTHLRAQSERTANRSRRRQRRDISRFFSNPIVTHIGADYIALNHRGKAIVRGQKTMR